MYFQYTWMEIKKMIVALKHIFSLEVITKILQRMRNLDL